jgi:hypothetical protein
VKLGGQALDATSVWFIYFVPRSSSYLAACDAACLYGECTAPQTCTCYAGWEGRQCSLPKCDITCVHGSCVRSSVFNTTSMVFKHSCQCDDGWEDEDCGTGMSFIMKSGFSLG